MTTSQPPPPPKAPPATATVQAAPKRAPQYSLRAMLILMTVVAVVFGVISFLGLRFVVALVSTSTIIAIPICFGTLAWYCRGYRQTLFLGALAGSLGAYLMGEASVVDDFYQLVPMAIFSLASSASGGLVAVFTRRFLERRGWHLPTGASDSTRPK